MDIERWFWGVPPVTRTYMLLSLGLAALVTYDFVNPLHLYLSFRLVFEKAQWWRLITTWIYLDRLSISLFFELNLFYFSCRRLEEHFYMRRTSDFVFVMLCGIAAIFTIAYFVDIQFLSFALNAMVLYLWSRRYPEERIMLWFLFTLSSAYLPAVVVVLTILVGGVQAATVELVGYGVGHVIWFLSDIFPKITGWYPMHAPAFLAAAFNPVHQNE